MKLIRRFRHWLKPDTLSEEMEAHLAFRIDELRDRGLPERDARAQARREFGNALQRGEESRDIWIARWLADAIHDVRFAFRTLAAARAFAAVAILSAALGIGGCSTIFGIANYVLFNRLPVAEPGRLVSVSGQQRNASPGDSISYPEVEDLRTAKSFDAVAGVFILTAGSFTSGVESHRHWGALVTANFFDIVRPGFVVGRGFDALRDDTPGAPRAIVLSHSLWQSRFGGDPRIVGKTIRWNDLPVTVTGVTAPGFRGSEMLLINEFWIPFSMIKDVPSLINDGSVRTESRGSSWLMATARLAPGRTIADAQAELRVLAAALAKQFPEQKDRGFFVQPAGQINAGAKGLLFVFFTLLAAVTVLVLLVASANVANLLLARASSRQKEIATRLAIGAGRGRLIRQLLAESLLLASAGGLVGCGIAISAASALSRIRLPIPLPLDFTILIDYRILLFSFLLALVTGVFFGLLPAWRATRMDLSGALKDETISLGGGGRRRFTLRNALVVTQVAISMLLLICSGLFLRSLYTAAHMNLGMHTRDVVFLSFDPTLNRYSAEKAAQFFPNLLERVRRSPGVEDASITHSVPLSIGGSNTRIQSLDRKVEVQTSLFVVAPRYFSTIGIGLAQGSDFRGSSADRDTVILNHLAAHRIFGRGNPIGQSVFLRGKPMRVIGVARDSKIRTIGEDPRACVYLPLQEYYGQEDSLMGFALLARTRGPSARFTEPLREQIRALDPALAIFDVKTIETHLEQAMLPPRLAAILFGLCGAVALLISTIGLYGVISFTVARRTKEIGIRIALGAERGRVIGLILRGGLTLAAIGIVIGTGAAFALSRVAASLLYGVSTTDAITFIGVPLLLLTIALGAAWFPARRAASLDPLRTLRYE